MRFKAVVLIPSVIVLVAAATLTGISAFGASSSRPTAQNITDDLSGAFASLRRPAISSDQLPPRAAAAAGQSLSSSNFGVNSGLSRRVLAKPDETLYLVAGNEELCLVRIEDFGSQAGCSNASDAIAGNMVGGVEKSTAGWRIDGVLPDGVPQVSFVANDGTATTIPVTDNVFSISVDKITDVPARITWNDGTGQAHQQILPPTAALPQ